MQFSFNQVPATGIDILKKYCTLFQNCFPQAEHLSEAYLSWLYWGNPEGSVVGYDAWDGDTLAAHYVCIPTRIKLYGRELRALLSLNTATHPDYQGKGLFTKLAELTYQDGAEAGFECVFGVANANSTPGFVRKLGFTLISPLEAKVGLGGFSSSWVNNVSEAEFSREWDTTTLAWRMTNPANPIALLRKNNGVITCKSRTHWKLINAYAEILPVAAASENHCRIGGACNVFIGLFPVNKFPSAAYIDIPKRFRPSPLNFIFRALNDRCTTPSRGNVLLSFLDFDAF